MSEITSFDNAKHYTWGDQCDGWRFLDRPDLSVIWERMPPDTCEKKHKHSSARQLFFIMHGKAEIHLGGKIHVLTPKQSLEIPPNEPHQIFNHSPELLEFILVSSPTTQGDRIDLNS